ncbi:hypothetical protein K9M48_03050 [Candidatus Gracilibacteria bacterium]|nr:hypothetical protein [Candidatus Gracilibacteria bacterium]
MIKNKSILKFGFLLAMFTSLPIYGANIFFNSTYPDSRFPPVDKLHAGCTHAANISIKTDGENINTISLVLEYDLKKVKILRVVPVDQSTGINYSVEYGKILFNKISNEEIKDKNTTLFYVYYQSQEDITGANFKFTQGSYITTKYGKVIPLEKVFSIPFEKAPECDPDIVHPSINLIKPINKSAGIALDSSFIFEIKDDGKGIDKKTLNLTIDDQDYKYNDDEVYRSGENLVVYPRKRLQTNKKIPIEISISDKQKYGGSNTESASFEVKTASGLVLEDYIDPFRFREISQGFQNYRGTQNECGLIGNIYIQEPGAKRNLSKSILKKLACPIPTETMELKDNEENIKTTILPIQEEKHKNYISVFGIIGRTLFIITFILKLHYRRGFSKHKKIIEQFKKMNIN